MPIINVALHVQDNWVRQKLDRGATEVLRQEWSCNHAGCSGLSSIADVLLGKLGKLGKGNNSLFAGIFINIQIFHFF